MNKGRLLCALLGTIISMTAATTAHSRSYTETEVRRQFAAYPILISIAKCESGMRQFGEDGKVLKNPRSSATGVMQIMSSIHRHAAAKLGFDIYKLEGNLAYARHLYRTEGTRPWKASAHCWGK